jgi:hypothetical protein
MRDRTKSTLSLAGDPLLFFRLQNHLLKCRLPRIWSLLGSFERLWPLIVKVIDRLRR